METTVKKRDWVKNAAIILLAVLLILTFFSNTIMNSALPEVSTTAVRSGAITSQIRGTGTVSASQNYEVMVEQSRKVKSVLVRQGQTVKAGDVLFVLAADSEELEDAEELLQDLTKQYQTAMINAGSTGVEWARQDLADAQAERDKNAYDEEALAGAERELEDAKAALKDVSAQLRQFGIYENLDEENLLQLEKDMRKREKAFNDAKRALESAKVVYKYRYDWIVARAERVIKNSREYQQLFSERDQRKYIADMLPAYMEFVMQEIENGGIVVDNPIEIVTDGNVVVDVTNDPSIVSEYRQAYDAVTKAQKDYDAAAEEYYSQDTRVTTVLTQAESALNRYTEAKDALEAIKEKRTNYQAAEEKVRAAEREITELNRSAALSSVEVADLADRVIRQQQKVDELRAGAEGTEIKAEVGGVVGSVAITAGNTTTPKTALATIEVPDMGYLVSFSVTADQARRVHTGDPANAANVYWGSQIEATLTGIKSDPKDPQNSKILTFEVHGDVTVGASLTLTVGQRGEEYDCIVPRSAVRPDSTNGDYVLVVTAKQSPLGDRYVANRVPVEVLARDDMNAAVSGALEQGDYVVTTSSAPIDNGKRVRLADTQ
ncbi:MAG: HlyD family efflux transporter periplasmic adaptor subunit [Oscillospiraceae bacterium]|nr:HlyD family efflux transporter periplasmic adaptor subunit [Oscillospiraceae bacterium]